MTQDLVPHQDQQPQPTFSSRALVPMTSVNQGAVAIEQERAIAEAQGQLVLAKKFPRNLTAAHSELMDACSVRAFAEVAFYSVPNRGSGPSIRFAEEVARVYGNFQYGHRELSRGDGKSEVEVYAWDMEKNNRSIRQITVLHTRDTRDGPKKLTDQADIDNRIANVASKQIRGRILALLPKWLVADAIEKCRQTLAGNTTEPVSVRVRKMLQAFAKYGVNESHLVTFLGHPLDDSTVDELVDLTGVYNAIKEGARASEFFSSKDADAEASATMANRLADTAKAGASAAQGSAGAEAPKPAAAAAPRARRAAAQQPAPQPPAQPEAPPPQQEAVAQAESSSVEEPPLESGQPDASSSADSADDAADLF